jgi:hypothetical protein
VFAIIAARSETKTGIVKKGMENIFYSSAFVRICRAQVGGKKEILAIPKTIKEMEYVYFSSDRVNYMRRSRRADS